jgi:hypothetical protein
MLPLAGGLSILMIRLKFIKALEQKSHIPLMPTYLQFKPQFVVNILKQSVHQKHRFFWHLKMPRFL